MPKKRTAPAASIWVATAEAVEVRGGRLQQLEIDQLTVNVNVFLNHMNEVLKNTPEKVGKFQFVEFEVSAEVSAEGQLVLMGTGGKAGLTGGLKFVFRRV
jgi:hypothetical protein